MTEQPNALEVTYLDETTIEQIAEFVAATGLTLTLRETLVKQYPDYRFICCSEDDMEDKPAYKEYDGFSVFLMAAGMGCARLTHTPEQAIGVVIAEHEAD